MQLKSHGMKQAGHKSWAVFGYSVCVGYLSFTQVYVAKRCQTLSGKLAF